MTATSAVRCVGFESIGTTRPVVISRRIGCVCHRAYERTQEGQRLRTPQPATPCSPSRYECSVFTRLRCWRLSKEASRVAWSQISPSQNSPVCFGPHDSLGRFSSLPFCQMQAGVPRRSQGLQPVTEGEARQNLEQNTCPGFQCLPLRESTFCRARADFFQHGPPLQLHAAAGLEMQLIADLRLTALSKSERSSLGKKLKRLAGGSCGFSIIRRHLTSSNALLCAAD